MKTRHSSGVHRGDPFNGGVYRSSSRNTYVKSSHTSHNKVNDNDSFTFASSIKCCVGFQPKKKKKTSRRVVAYQSQHKVKEREIAWERMNGISCGVPAGRGEYPPNMCGYSPNHSRPSSSRHAHSSSHKQSSSYPAEIESSQVVLMEAHDWCESDSDSSDGDFARGAAGARGKSANSVMMKLAKKFSKKNFLVTRDDGDEESTGGVSLEKVEDDGHSSALKMKHRSNSASNLDSMEG